MAQETSSRKASVTHAYSRNDFIRQLSAMSAAEAADYLARMQSRQERSRSLRAFRCEAATLDRPLVVGQRRLPRNDTVEAGQRRLMTENLLCLHLGRVAG